MNLAKVFVVAGALFGASGVLLGAFGAHALRARLDASSMSSWDTAVQYQLIHALALVITGVWLTHGPTHGLKLAGWSFVIGTVFFSGSLYVLVLSGARWLGPVTPAGGVAFMLGWAALAWAGMRLHD